LMGAIADKYADIIIVTDDDAWTENRLAIINEICEPIKRQQGHNFFIIPEREFALKFCVDIAQPWDYVIFAGKWHEQVLLTNFGKRPRNDKQALISYCESITSPSVSSSWSQ
jgi:UDP-N-acetylmuramoyl-L-alanyl-D-glutamate--2,6-diaminopimelate ligase